MQLLFSTWWLARYYVRITPLSIDSNFQIRRFNRHHVTMHHHQKNWDQQWRKQQHHPTWSAPRSSNYIHSTSRARQIKNGIGSHQYAKRQQELRYQGARIRLFTHLLKSYLLNRSVKWGHGISNMITVNLLYYSALPTALLANDIGINTIKVSSGVISSVCLFFSAFR